MRRPMKLGVGVALIACAAQLGHAQWSVSGSNIFYNSGNVGIGTSSPIYRLFVQTDSGTTAIFGSHMASSGSVFGVWGQSASSLGVGVLGWATATTGWTRGVVGINSSPSGGGVVGAAYAPTGETYGVFGEAASVSGIGVWGNATATSGSTFGVRGQSASTNGVGVFGNATATSGSTFGVRGQSASTNGVGVWGWATATTGWTRGVIGTNSSPSGGGVVGAAYAPTGQTYGVMGESSSVAGMGVYGLAAATTGVNYGVYGVSSSPDGFGVYAQGDMGASGLKSFRIDHPLRPETHYLLHYCIEAPEPLNAYSGVAALDARGEAWIELPDYFDAINRDPRYTLTPIGAPMPNLHVAVEVQGNRFKIAGGAPGKRVSWRIEAVRNDPYVQRRGFQAEREKPREHIGKYLHPELYGQPKERAMHPETPNPAPAERVSP